MRVRCLRASIGNDLFAGRSNLLGLGLICVGMWLVLGTLRHFRSGLVSIAGYQSSFSLSMLEASGSIMVTMTRDDGVVLLWCAFCFLTIREVRWWRYGMGLVFIQ